MRSSLLLPALLAIALASPAMARPAPQSPAARAMIVSFDGAGEQVIGHLMQDGAMPHLARLASEGASASYSRTNFPSKTAAGHAALWTGTFGNVNGITSNRVFKLPLASFSVLDVQDAFTSTSLLAEPIFVTAARAGKRALVLEATHLTPLDVYEPGGRFGGPFAGSLTICDGFGGIKGVDGVECDPKVFHAASGWGEAVPAGDAAHPPKEARMRIMGAELWAVASHDATDPRPGYNTLRLFAGKDPHQDATVLKPVAATDRARLAAAGSGTWVPSPALRTKTGPASAFFRLYELDPELRSFRLYHTAPTLASGNRPEAVDRYYGRDDAFIPAGGQRSYMAAGFGAPLWAGGDGTAEDRYLDTIAFVMDRMADRTHKAFARRDWDLLVNYVPFPDETLHVWYGFVDRNSPSYDPTLAPRVWRLLDRVGSLVDGYIGGLQTDALREAALDHRPNNTALAIASDHGFAGLKWQFHPNEVLRRAGLLAVTPDGKIDLAHTRVIYPPTDGAFLVVNSTAHKGGIVAPADVPNVLDAAERALCQVMVCANGSPPKPDELPVHGKRLLTRFIRPSAANFDLGLGGVRGGDAYLDLLPGYYFSSEWSGPRYTPEAPGTGSHIFDPRRPDMHAIQFYWGAGVRRGAHLGPVRNEDLAPTVSRLLGMPAPAQATGRVLEGAIAPALVQTR